MLYNDDTQKKNQLTWELPLLESNALSELSHSPGPNLSVQCPATLVPGESLRLLALKSPFSALAGSQRWADKPLAQRAK